MGRFYNKPEGIAAPSVVASQESNELTANTPVTVIFRGGPPIRDMYDSRDYTVPPVPEGVTLDEWRATMQPASYWTLPYEVAVHLQNRAIVPGSRDPHSYKKALSQIGIVNADREDRCEPLTEAELKMFGNREGLDRTQFMDQRRDIQFVETRSALASGILDVDQVLDAPPDAAAIAPPGEIEGLEDARNASNEGVQGSRTRRGKARFDDEKS